MGNITTHKAQHKIYRDQRVKGEVGGGTRWVSLHFEDTGSKSPHRSELAVATVEGGAAELELVASRSTKEPGDRTIHT